MKKIGIIGVFCFLCIVLSAQKVPNIFEGALTTVDNYKIDLRSLAGKKLMIATFDASKPDITFLASLDSLNLIQFDQLTIIGIAINDFGASVSVDSLLSIIRRLKLSFPVTKPVNGKRGTSQFAIMQWITTNSTKNHFNIDLQSASGLYLISSSSLLYAILPRTTDFSSDFFQKLLKTDPSN